MSKGLGEERGLFQSAAVHGRAPRRVFASNSTMLHCAEAPSEAPPLIALGCVKNLQS